MNESKKIEPTIAMVDEAANILSLNATGTSLRFHDDPVKLAYRNRVTPALRAALNHPDAPGLFTDEDALRAAREQGWDQAVDWIKRDQGGPSGRTTNARKANPHRRAPHAEEVELPTEPCVLTDVRLREALVAGVALWTGLEVVAAGFNGLAAVHPVSDLTAFTLPDGIRARRDGDHPDGEPRFFKTQEES
ncbi:hypothetical protein M3E78_005695 [Micrococcus luteus]|nr:hypothetical protein [Micrococcus luteus]MCV7574101.1 hypothetical protein [Micrococcus luteus]